MGLGFGLGPGLGIEWWRRVSGLGIEWWRRVSPASAKEYLAVISSSQMERSG